uniref:Cilia- and flagella-associated protein HOATZ n=1 Tax=Salvator merianae TaxID=96440 RepID=A0A8D0KNB7_SALMN
METRAAAVATGVAQAARPSAPPPPPPGSMAAPSMSSTAPPPPPSSPSAALVFAGTSEDDVALAKSFWNSVTLQPPLESRLNSRRDSLSSGGGSSRKGSQAQAVDGPRVSHHERSSLLPLRSFDDDIREGNLLEILEAEKNNLREQYLQKHHEPLHRTKSTEMYSSSAKKREEIIALLKKQREERIVKESVSQMHKPQNKTQESAKRIPESDMEDKDSVRALV